MSDLQAIQFIAEWARTHFQEQEYEHAVHVQNLAGSIFDALDQWISFPKRSRFYLEAAALLHDSGLLFGAKKHHKKSLEFILELDLPVIQSDKLIIANVARYHRKAWPAAHHPHFEELALHQKAIVYAISPILRVADGLDRSHAHVITSLSLEKTDQEWVFNLQSNHKNPDAELFGFQQKKDFFEYVFQRSTKINILSILGT